MLTRIRALLAVHPRWTAFFAGGISATGFAPLGLWPLTLIAVALLLWLLERASSKRSSFLLGYVWGVGHFAISLNWIATAFTFQAAMPAWLGWIAVLLLSLYLALFPALAAMVAWWGVKLLNPSPSGEGLGWGLSKKAELSGQTPPAIGVACLHSPPPLKGRGESPLLLLFFAAAWIITEWLRSWVFTGFAWNPLSAAIVDFAAPSGLFGTYGLSGLTIVIVGALIMAVRQPGLKSAAPIASLALLYWLSTFAHGFQSGNDANGIPVTIVQPNIQQGDKWDPAIRVENFRKLARLSIREPDAAPRLLLWPEAAVPDYLEDGYPRDWLLEPASFTRARLASLLGPNDLLLTGAVKLDPTPDGRDIAFARNSLFVLDAQRRIAGRYDKAHLVPYGEYLPARVLLEPLGLSRLAPGATDFRHGPGPRTLDLGRFGSVGVQICYEIIFSGQVVDRANRPDFIFNPSNDAWFGAWGPPQHLAQARLRAIEEGLPVVRATPTGISAIIAPDGRVLESVPMGQAGRIDANLPLPGQATMFARFGNILPLLLAVFLASCGVAIGRRWR